MKFVSNTGRTGVFLLGLIATLGGSHALAQTTATTTTTTGITLATGAWNTNIQATINGRNSTQLLQNVQSELVQMLPVGLKEGAAATMNARLNRVNATTCITSQTAAAMSSPATLFKTMSRMNPLCMLTPGRLTATTQYFSGSCADPFSFTGKVTGRVVIDSPTSWRASFTGNGQVPDRALQALGLAPGSIVQMQTVSVSRLTSTSCPVTTTTVASAR